VRDEKMIRTAKRLDVCMNIAEKAFYVITALLAVLGVAMAVFKDAFTDYSVTNVPLGVITLTLKEADIVVSENVKSRLIVGIISAMIVLAITCVGIRIIRKILRPMKEGRPFDTSVADSLKKLGWLVLIGGTVEAILKAVSETVILGAYDLSQLINMNAASKVTVSYFFDATFIIFAFVLFLLSHVFRYGEELQRESDETL